MGNDPVTLTPLVRLSLESSVTRFGKVAGCLCLRFTPTFIYDQDVAMWTLPHTTTVTQRAGPCHFEKTPRVTDVSCSGSPHLLPSQLHPATQSGKVPTWKLHSVSSGSLHTLARAVCEALAKRRLYLESKHFHSWVLREVRGGGDRGQLAHTEGTL